MDRDRDLPAYGYKPDPRVSSARAEELIVDPSKVDLVDSDARITLEGWAPAARFQGRLGSCTAHAGRGAAMALSAMAERDGLLGGELFDLSCLAIYQQSLADNGHFGADMGVSGTSMLRVLTRGLPREELWPYQDVLPDALPPRGVWSPRRVVDWFQVAHSVRSLRAALAMGCPIVIGVPTFSGLHGMGSAHAFETGEVSEPERGEEITGWHMVSLWSHDPSTGLCEIQNSWRGWGRPDDKARCMGTLPVDYVLGRANEILAVSTVR